MTEEQVFKARFPKYCVGEKCLSPYFDLFQIGFEEGENQSKQLQEELHRQVLLRVEDREKGKEWYNEMEELQEENKRLKKESEENQDLATIAYMQGASKYKAKLEYAKTIIEELLSSCFGYNSKTVNYDVKAKAEEFLKGK